jgi:hypothetical protein
LVSRAQANRRLQPTKAHRRRLSTSAPRRRLRG